MDTFKKQDLERLLLVEAEGCVTLYLPTFKTGPEVQQAPILLKNLTKEAEERLVRLGRRRPEVLEFLKPLDQLLHDSEFWKHQEEGLALFLTPDRFETFRLPHRFEPSISVDHRLNVRPLLPHLHGDGVFYLLAVSQNDVRCFKGSRTDMEELDIESLPLNKDQALGLDKSQSITLKNGPGASFGVPTHGSLELSDIEKNEVRQYFRKVDQALSEILKAEKAPLIFAGVEAHFALYKEANTYPHLFGECLKGNPEVLSPAQLHSKAWPLVQNHFMSPFYAAREKFSMLHGKNSPLASAKFEEIFFAAHQSRIETLMVSKTASQWGTFDLEQLQLEPVQEVLPEHRDLLSAMLPAAIQSGATVYTLDLEEMPEGEPIAALFRY